MTNYYQDNTDIQFQLKKRDLTRVVSLVEDDFSDGNKYPHAPKDLDDALDNYERVLSDL